MVDDKEALLDKIDRLQIEHRDLDEVIARLQEQGVVDQLMLRRMKKRKLLIKDIIQRIGSKLIPDLDA